MLRPRRHTATVTDADVVLGYLPTTGFAGGRMELDVDAAREAIRREVAEPLGIDVVEAAWGIERIVNANMANATRKVLAGHGADPRKLALIAYGGNGGVHAWSIAPELGIETVLVPKTAPAFSALGVLVADYVIDLVRSYVAPLSQVDMQRVGALAAELLDEAAKELTPADLEPGSVAYDLYAQMCYPGQNFDLSIPMPAELSQGTAGDAGDAIAGSSLLELAERFHDQHEAERGILLPQHAAPAAAACAWWGAGPHRSRAGSRAPGRVAAPRREGAVRPTSTAPSTTRRCTRGPIWPPVTASRAPRWSRNRSRWWWSRPAPRSSSMIWATTCSGAEPSPLAGVTAG